MVMLLGGLVKVVVWANDRFVSKTAAKWTLLHPFFTTRFNVCEKGA